MGKGFICWPPQSTRERWQSSRSETASPALITTGNTFSGDLVLDGGNLGWNNGGPGEFGTGRVVVTSNGGTLFVNGNNSSNGARFGTMQVDGNLRVLPEATYRRLERLVTMCEGRRDSCPPPSRAS